ncbi:hypothetical protein GGI11_006524 [Coemansia sp. RSA 2049]|nr:hypothetical protein GGI11_006524 [Coemansia sp. RSA 2049]
MLLNKYKRLVVIGDSNADTGNVMRMTQGTHPEPSDVYVDGRYSNGRMWVDHLERLSGCKGTINLAHGCATADNEIVSGTVPMPPDGIERKEVPSVVDQVQQLKELMGQLLPTDLVFVQAGSNDINALIADGPTYVIKRRFTPELIAQRIGEAVRQLCNAGARTVVVMNVRPRDEYPGVIALRDVQRLQATRRDTLALNESLAQEMAALQGALGATGCRIAVFDTHGFQKRITADPVAHGIDPDLATPCFDENRVLDAAGSNCMLHPESKLFLDGAHLAKRGQKLLAAEVIKMLSLLAMEEEE